MDIAKPNHKIVRSTGALRPGQNSSCCRLTEQFGWVGHLQHIQDLLLDSVQLGKLTSNQASVWVPNMDDTVMGEGFQNAWHAGPQMIAAFWHQTVDRLLPLGQYPSYLSFNQACDQAADHNQENQGDNAMGLFKKTGPTRKTWLVNRKQCSTLYWPFHSCNRLASSNSVMGPPATSR